MFCTLTGELERQIDRTTLQATTAAQSGKSARLRPRYFTRTGMGPLKPEPVLINGALETVAALVGGIARSNLSSPGAVWGPR
jgi:hypothetical protein